MLERIFVLETRIEKQNQTDWSMTIPDLNFPQRLQYFMEQPMWVQCGQELHCEVCYS